MENRKDIESPRPSGASAPWGEYPQRPWLWLALVLFLVRSLPWAMSEYWYDEVLTITNFSMDVFHRGLWKSVFCSYPIANNHILNSALYYEWIHLLQYHLTNELLVRVPSLLAGTGTIVMVMWHWHRFLGLKISAFMGILLSFSPVFTSYAWQIRGYSLTFFLCVLGLSGVLEIHRGGFRTGVICSAVSCFLLPLVIPSNAVVVPLLAIGGLFAAISPRRRWLNFGCSCLAGGIGLSHYLTIWPQFQKAMAEPDGWSSCWMVLVALLGGFVIHAAVPLFHYLRSLWLGQKSREETKVEDAAVEKGLDRLGMCLGFGSFLMAALLLLVSRSGHAPFPRVFLVLLLPATLSLFLAIRHLSFSLGKSVAAVVILGAISTVGGDQYIRRSLAAGRVPDNLLVQYYRGSTDLRECVWYILKNRKDSYIVTDPYDYPTTMFYWNMYGGESRCVTASNMEIAVPSGRSVLVIARTEGQVNDFLKMASKGVVGQPHILTKCGVRYIGEWSMTH